MKQYILLDWDGNLARTLDVWLEAIKVPLVKRSIQLSDKQVAMCFGRLVERFTEYGITDIDAAVEEIQQFAKQRIPEADLYPDALFVLEELKKQDKKLALVTSTFKHILQGALSKHGMDELFDVVVTGTDVENLKPHPEPLLLAMERLNAVPADTIMIGDTEHDVAAANSAGVESILFFPTEHEFFYDIDILKAHSPTYVIDDFRRVLDIV